MSALEDRLIEQLRAHGLPAPEREVRFHPTRRWRFDLAWPAMRLAVEVEGGIYVHGRHTRAVGFQRDAEKYNAAALAGWRVLRYTAKEIASGTAAAQIARVLVESPGGGVRD